MIMLGYLLGGIPIIRHNFEKVVLLIIGVSLLPALLQVVNERRRCASASLTRRGMLD